MNNKLNKHKIDISIIVCVHNEGRLIHHTLSSISAAIKTANKKNLKAELIIIADSPSEKTVDFLDTIKDHPYDYTVKEVAYTDAGLSRNHGIKLAKGEYVCLIDGDDMMHQDWLTRAYEVLEQSREDIIVHPQYMFSFGAEKSLWKINSSTSSQFSKLGLIEFNYFCAMMMTSTNIARQNPYRYTSAKDLWGYEDWLWNCDTLNAGVEHLVVLKTMYAYRSKETGSRLSSHRDCLLPPTDYFGPKNVPKFTVQQLDRFELGYEKASRKYLKKILLRTLIMISKVVLYALQPFKVLHHRIDYFLKNLQNEIFHLFRPPGTPGSSKVKKCPSWLIENIRDLSDYDHRVFLNEVDYKNLLIYTATPRFYTSIYWRLAKEVGECSHLFLLPWLKKGGADLEVINYTKAITELNPDAKIVLLATNDDSSPWANRLGKNVKFITIDKKFTVLSLEQQVRLLATLCVQLKPKHIHLVNSPTGYALYKTYAKPLSEVSKLYAQLFCIDESKEGGKAHYLIDQLQEKIDYLTGVFTDNKKVISDVVKLQALPIDKFVCHYQPIEASNVTTPKLPMSFNAQRKLRVLWAGRLDNQKRPDILIKIAKEIERQGLPIIIDVYGSEILDNSHIINDLQNSAVISYKGPYDNGIFSLDIKQYNVFLINSQWEGLPNAVLEAMVVNLTVVASSVGGLPELVTDKTGYLINPYNDIDAYIVAFKDIIDNPGIAEDKRQKARHLINERHSWQHFIDQVKESGYAG